MEKFKINRNPYMPLIKTNLKCLKILKASTLIFLQKLPNGINEKMRVVWVNNINKN